MQAEQRARVDKKELEPQARLWQPFTVHGADGDDWKKRRAFAGDRYVVIEDIADGRVVFEVSNWPHIDQGGRLHFEGDPTEIYDDLATAQAMVDGSRRRDSVTGPDRPLRVGDVFAVRGLPAGAQSITEADLVRDVSLAARRAAKAAMYGAAASTVEPEYVEKMAIEGDIPEPDYGSGEFDVRQVAMGKLATMPEGDALV